MRQKNLSDCEVQMIYFIPAKIPDLVLITNKRPDHLLSQPKDETEY